VPAPTTTAAPLYGGHTSEVYADDASWLCTPHRSDDPCDDDLDTTVIEADGTMTVEPFMVDADAPIDCFYVYPTISMDATPNSDLVPGPEEAQVVRNQAARLGSVCRVFAPMYRQLTLTALMGFMRGEGGEEIRRGDSPERGMAYGDVLDAWKHYIDNDNGGRGVVLIGHSQGSGVLTQLIAEEIDDDEAVRSRLVGAYLIGSSVSVPEDDVVGGTFQNVPACHFDDEIGCVVSFASFAASDPPAEGALFGRPREGEGIALCRNPAAPEGGPARLHNYFPVGAAAGFEDRERNAEITTPFVSLPDLVVGECVLKDGFSYLEVSVERADDDVRVREVGGTFLPGWGLHLVDVNLVMGDIVSMVDKQAAAWAAS
jgi:hypothetical protein